MKLIRSLSVLDRLPLIVVLIAANLALLAIVPQLITWSGLRGQQVHVWLLGLGIGELVWLSLWFSFSRIPWGWRTLVVAGALLPASAFTLRGYLPYFLDFREFLKSFAVASAWVLSIYVCVLPIRRLRGIALGIRDATPAKTESRQFLIRDFAVWSALFVAPLAILRASSPTDLFLVGINFFAIFILLELLLGIPLFVASLSGRWTAAAIPVALLYLLGGAWLLGEVFYLISDFGNGGPYPDFRILAHLLLPAAAVVCVNNLCLQILGLRFLSVGRSEPRVKPAI